MTKTIELVNKLGALEIKMERLVQDQKNYSEGSITFGRIQTEIYACEVQINAVYRALNNI